MKHYGDICKLNGADLPVVDVITGGSPCQNLSIAGTRTGLQGEESGLFFEQIRIVKEMREHDRATGRSDEFVRPRYMVWENVPGAFNSNKGQDFQIVLTEIVRIVNSNCPDVPIPPSGKWSKSGCIMGYGDSGCPFSIAWRLHDAQFWGATQYADGRMLTRGTPQRRKRIALVADFNGISAGEVLFERYGLHWNSEKSQEKGKNIAGCFEDGTGDPGEITDLPKRSRIFTTAKQDYHTKALSDKAFALTASDYKDPPTITIVTETPGDENNNRN